VAFLEILPLTAELANSSLRQLTPFMCAPCGMAFPKKPRKVSPRLGIAGCHLHPGVMAAHQLPVCGVQGEEEAGYERG